MRALTEAFNKARSGNDGDAMRAVAVVRRPRSNELADLLALARNERAAGLTR